MLKVVVDTNIFLDAIFKKDKGILPIFEKEYAREIQFVTCGQIIDELMKKVKDMCLELNFKKNEIFTIEATIAKILARSYYQNIEGVIPRYCEHFHDDIFIECAKVSGAEYVISSDAHISDLPGCIKDFYRIEAELIHPLDFLYKYNSIIDTHLVKEKLVAYSGKEFNNGIRVGKKK